MAEKQFGINLEYDGRGTMGPADHRLMNSLLRVIGASFSPVVDGAEEGGCTYTKERRREGKTFLCLNTKVGKNDGASEERQI